MDGVVYWLELAVGDGWKVWCASCVAAMLERI